MLILTLLASLAVAALLSVVPLPDGADYFRPLWISLLMAWWCLRYPQQLGLSACLAVGLLWDVLLDVPFGTYPLLLCLQAWMILSIWQRLQMYPLFQQSFVIFLLIGVEIMLLRALLGFAGAPAPDLLSLFAALTSALLWPLLATLLDRSIGY